ncbi:MAG: septum formation initiator family protein [Actinobacteria bacterium]|nr:septum formation initiator family protein [Actinomycetota bacterium]
MERRQRGRRRPSRSRRRLRWLLAGAVALAALFYYQPVRSYLETRQALAVRSGEVQALRAEQRRLEQRLAASTSQEAILRQARRIGFVKPGQRLFIIKGIGAWRRLRAEPNEDD